MSQWSLELVLDPVAATGAACAPRCSPSASSSTGGDIPVIDGEEIPPALYEHAVRAVQSCPKQALHLVERRC